MTTANPLHARIGALARGWRGFRRWRRARPFWGGLLLLLAGLEIFQSTQASLGGLTFQMGPTGFLSWLIPTILAACGLLMWFTPQQRMFYAIVGAMTAVFSLIAVNLGGFFIGMLLGMIGGALGFAWTPVAPVLPAGPDELTETEESDSFEPPIDDTTVDELIAGPLTDTLPQPRNPLRESVEEITPAVESAERGEPEQAGGAPSRGLPETSTEPNDQSGYGPPLPRRSPPTYVITLIMLSVAMIGAATLRGQAAHADPCPSPVEATATATTATTTPELAASAIPAPTASPDAAMADSDVSVAAATPTTDSTTSSAATPTATPSAKPTPTPATCSTGKPAATQAGEPAGPVKRIAPAADQPKVNKVPSHLSGSKVTMYGLRLDGVVDLPTADGTLRALLFSMRKAVTDDFKLQIPGKAEKRMLVKSTPLTIDGDVAFYATRFSGRVGGIEVTLTPDSPVPPEGVDLTVPMIVFDDPDVQLAFVACNKLTASGFAESFV